MTETLTLEDFPYRSYDKLRYGDTDRQGHVNNAVIATCLETARTELLEKFPWRDGPTSYVIASLKIEFIAEVFWPGTVEVGTKVARVGRSSIALEHGIFQNGKLVGKSEAVMVHVDNATHRSAPLTDAARAAFLGK